MFKKPETIVLWRHWFGPSLRPGKPSNSPRWCGGRHDCAEDAISHKAVSPPLLLFNKARSLSLHCRQDWGEPVKLLCENTLRLMWMLPFVTRTDLETAAKGKDDSQDTRDTFLNKLLAEHGLPAVREQLKTLWTKWVESNCPEEPAAVAVASSHAMDAPTPPDDDDEALTDAQMLDNVAAAGAAEAAGGG